MPITACHHFAINIRDVEEARSFWAGALGLTELERPEAIAHIPGVWFQIGVSELHAIQDTEAAPSGGPIGPHIALHTDDFESTVERVKAAGYEFSFGPGRGPDGILRAVTRDPTGNVVEITDAALRAAPTG